MTNAVATGLLALVVTGCEGDVAGPARQVDPKLVSEARAASPECRYPRWMSEKKETYTKDEFDQITRAAEACNKAVGRYLQAKYKGKY